MPDLVLVVNTYVWYWCLWQGGGGGGGGGVVAYVLEGVSTLFPFENCTAVFAYLWVSLKIDA